MLLSQIQKLFQQKTDTMDFGKHIAKEVSDYKKTLSKKGSCSPIYLNEDIETLNVNQQDIQFLCEAFLNNNLNEWELNYIAEALLLSEKPKLENDKVENALLALSDPEYFSLISKEFIIKILRELI